MADHSTDSASKARQLLRSLQESFAWSTHVDPEGDDYFQGMYSHWSAQDRESLHSVPPETDIVGSSHFSSILAMLAAIIEAEIAEEGKGLLRRAIIGALQARSPSVLTLAVPDSQDHIILVDSDLMVMTWQMSKIFAEACPPNILERSVDDDVFHDRFVDRLFENEIQAHKGLGNVVFSKTLYGAASSAPPFEVSTPRVFNFADRINFGMQLFFVAHEYAHLLLHEIDSVGSTDVGVKDDVSVGQTVWSWRQEFEADVEGSFLAMTVLNKIGYPRSLGFGIIDLYFTTLSILDRCKEYTASGAQQPEVSSSNFVATHPPPLERRDALRRHWSEVLQRGFPPVAAAIKHEEMLRFARRSSAMIDTLWQICLDRQTWSLEKLQATLNRTGGSILD